MNKILLTVASLATTTVMAQINVTSIYNHSAGTINTANFKAIEINTTITKNLAGGNGVLWSYDTCVQKTVAPTTYNIITKDTTGVTNSASVAGRANVALNEDVNANYSFYDLSTKFSIAAENFQILGNEAYVPYNNNIDLLSFPMTYNATVTSMDTANAWAFPPSNTMKRYIKSTMTYDGYGSLKLNNTLTLDSISRIKLEQTITDTLIAPANPFLNKINSKRIVYYYVRAGKNLVAQWEMDSVANAFSTQKIYKFIVADNYNIVAGITQKNATVKQLEIYPNPAQNKITVTLASSEYTPYTVYNTLGKTVIQGAMNNLHNTIDLSNLPTGVYILRTNDGKQQARIVKE
jgi:hypothetical protein